MGFLDNSGDIILDAVLTDAGRKRMARGDGTFKVTKYAFGDDEIDYGKYQPNHDSGSAYYDLEILQTPVLEAFTNNRSSLKRKLISLTNNNLLFLPVILLNQCKSETSFAPSSSLGGGVFMVSTDQSTNNRLDTTVAGMTLADQYINGIALGTSLAANHIRTDQGLNTNKLDATFALSTELKEQQYLIQIDNRLGAIYDVVGGAPGSPAFIDDDQIASYYVTMNVGKYVTPCATGPLTGDAGGQAPVGCATDAAEILPGPRGTRLRFSILASNNLKSSTFLFTTMGSTATFQSTTYLILDTTIKVTGVTTGYSINIPVRFVKLND